MDRTTVDKPWLDDSRRSSLDLTLVRQGLVRPLVVRTSTRRGRSQVVGPHFAALARGRHRPRRESRQRSGPGTVLDQVVRLLRSHPGVSARMPDPARPVLIRSGPSSRRLVAFFFAHGASQPTLFVKLATVPKDRLALVREHQNLHSVAAIAELVVSVPEPLAILELPEVTLSVQSGLPGTSFAAMLRRRVRPGDPRTDLAPALHWLARFQQLTTTGTRPAIEANGFAARISEYLPQPAHQRLRNRLIHEAEGLQQTSVPVVRRHGDYWPGNILCHGEQVRIVDWEHSAAGWAPAHDMFMLLTTYAALVPGRGQRLRTATHGFESAWLTPGPLSRRCREQASAFLSGLDITPPALDVLLVDFLTEMIDSPPFGDSEHWHRLLRGYAATLQVPGRTSRQARGDTR